MSIALKIRRVLKLRFYAMTLTPPNAMDIRLKTLENFWSQNFFSENQGHRILYKKCLTQNTDSYFTVRLLCAESESDVNVTLEITC